MQYLFLLYDNEANAPEPKSDEEFAEMMKPWFEYNAFLNREGKMLGGEALQPTATATTVTNHDDKPVFTDGPFAETKEQLGGFYLVEARDLDHALTLAAQCPAAKWGKVEVRPIMELPSE